MQEGKLSNPFLYNGKELLDEDMDLGWYDYGFRDYDPQIGRFVEMDPLTDYFSGWSSYVYAGNDPITNIDAGGLGPEKIVEKVATTVEQLHELENVTVIALRKIGASASTIAKIRQIFSITERVVNLITKLNTVAVGASTRTYSTPDGGSIQLPNGASNLQFNSSDGVEGLVRINKSVKDAPNSLHSFDFEGEAYADVYNLSDGMFAGYSTRLRVNSPEISYSNSDIASTSLSPQAPNASKAFSLGAIALSRTPGPIQAKVATAGITIAGAYVLNSVLINVNVAKFYMTSPAAAIGGYLYSDAAKTADELISSRGKKSPSYNPKYGNKTLEELQKLAKSGDQIAAKMKKLAQEAARLLDKTKQKHR